jgi:AcrR family transcriptional regulator
MARAGLSASRVIAEAAAVAHEAGLERKTLAAVANRLGVSLPSIYKHVNGLDALRRELALLGLRELTVLLSSAAVGRSGKPCRVWRMPIAGMRIAAPAWSQPR